MKYTFQDSTELPVQRDFIKDLQDFIKVSEEIIPLERESLIFNSRKKKDTLSFESQSKLLDEFSSGVIASIKEMAQSFEGTGISGVDEKATDSILSISSEKKTELGKQLDESVKTADFELDQLSTKMFSILDPFFKEGIYKSRSTYTFLQNDGNISGKQTAFVGEMEYWFELVFNANKLKVDSLSKKFSLPVWVSGGLLHREDKVKKMDLSDYYIVSMDYDGDEKLEALLKDDDSEHVFRIVSDHNSLAIFHNENDIMADEELVKTLEKENVSLFILKMQQYFSVAVQSRTLSKVIYDGRDAISNNLLFECLKIIASIYGNLITQCLEKGYSENEITIKMELPDETRTEKYITKYEIFRQLSDIGAEGLKLAGILNVSDI